VFGAGRDDWDADERLFSGDRGDLSRTDFEFRNGDSVPGYSPDSVPGYSTDSRQQEPAGRSMAEEGGSALVRPYAVTGGRTKPRYQLQIEAMVAASH
jgi:hypothetical protein